MTSFVIRCESDLPWDVHWRTVSCDLLCWKSFSRFFTHRFTDQGKTAPRKLLFVLTKRQFSLSGIVFNHSTELFVFNISLSTLTIWFSQSVSLYHLILLMSDEEQIARNQEVGWQKPRQTLSFWPRSLWLMFQSCVTFPLRFCGFFFLFMSPFVFHKIKKFFTGRQIEFERKNWCERTKRRSSSSWV